MKTSIILDDKVFKEAKKESFITGESISTIISKWASIGRELDKKLNKTSKKFTPVDLGELKIDLTNRKDWMEKLK